LKRSADAKKLEKKIQQLYKDSEEQSDIILVTISFGRAITSLHSAMVWEVLRVVGARAFSTSTYSGALEGTMLVILRRI
jgi:hypothetical protein